jgi:hypothetical protein
MKFPSQTHGHEADKLVISTELRRTGRQATRRKDGACDDAVRVVHLVQPLMANIKALTHLGISLTGSSRTPIDFPQSLISTTRLRWTPGDLTAARPVTIPLWCLTPMLISRTPFPPLDAGARAIIMAASIKTVVPPARWLFSFSYYARLPVSRTQQPR